MRLGRQKQPQRRDVAPTQSANVFSYHSSRSAPETARGRYEDPAGPGWTNSLRNVPTILAMIVIVGVLLYASLLNSDPRLIVAASSTGKPLQRSNQTYQKFISKQLETSLLNKSKLTFNGASLTEALRAQFPEVADAVVTLPLIGHRPIVRIAVSSPAFVLATNNGAYYISADGKPLIRVSEVTNPLPNITTVSDETNLPVTVGKQILPADTVKFVSEMLQQFAATNTKLTSVTLPLEANEIQVRVEGTSYVIRFNSLEDARLQVGTYLAVKQRLEGKVPSPKEYIDVRVPERAYYK